MKNWLIEIGVRVNFLGLLCIIYLSNISVNSVSRRWCVYNVQRWIRVSSRVSAVTRWFSTSSCCESLLTWSGTSHVCDVPTVNSCLTRLALASCATAKSTANPTTSGQCHHHRRQDLMLEDEDLNKSRPHALSLAIPPYRLSNESWRNVESCA